MELFIFFFFWFIHYFELCDIILDFIWIIYIHIHIHTYTCDCRCMNVQLVQVFQRNCNAVLWRHTRRPTQMLARTRHLFPEHKRNPKKQFQFLFISFSIPRKSCYDTSSSQKYLSGLTITKFQILNQHIYGVKSYICFHISHFPPFMNKELMCYMYLVGPDQFSL